MLVTRDTSQAEMSPLNDSQSEKAEPMSITPEMSQDPIGPYAPVAQSLSSWTHSRMASVSSRLELGVKITVILGCLNVHCLKRGAIRRCACDYPSVQHARESTICEMLIRGLL